MICFRNMENQVTVGEKVIPGYIKDLDKETLPSLQNHLANMRNYKIEQGKLVNSTKMKKKVKRNVRQRWIGIIAAYILKIKEAIETKSKASAKKKASGKEACIAKRLKNEYTEKYEKNNKALAKVRSTIDTLIDHNSNCKKDKCRTKTQTNIDKQKLRKQQLEKERDEIEALRKEIRSGKKCYRLSELKF